MIAKLEVNRNNALINCEFARKLLEAHVEAILVYGVWNFTAPHQHCKRHRAPSMRCTASTTRHRWSRKARSREHTSLIRRFQHLSGLPVEH
eukprot:80002-Pleurochrysis_carterae.AAC.1